MSRDITIPERVWEIFQWEIHLRRCLVINLREEVRSAVKLGLAEKRLGDIVENDVKEIDDLFLQIRTKTFEELHVARMNGFKFKEGP